MVKFFRLILIIFLSVLTFKILKGGDILILDSLDLIIHEAGHTIFFLFSDFIQTLGGTLIQILAPLIFVLYFLRRWKLFASSVMLWWFGENLIDISLYIADARAESLPLIGGYHDWAYLLARMNILRYDILIGKIVMFLGVVIMVLSLILGLVIIFKKPKPELTF